MTTPKVSLDDFANEKKARCGVCALSSDVRGQVDASLAAGSVGPTIISRWLRDECGIQITSRVVKHHQESAHHVRTAEVREEI